MVAINVLKSAGAGRVLVKRNDIQTGEMMPQESSKAFLFDPGDTFSFEAVPSPGWVFEKYCVDQVCSDQSTINPFTGNIVTNSGNLYVFFKPLATGGW